MDTSTEPTDPDPLPEITASELEVRLDDEEELVLVDVREPFEKEIADLPYHGQLRIPVGEFERRLDEIPSEPAVVLYCRTGARSAWATRLLVERGHGNAFNLAGGVMGWRDEVDPSLQAY